MVPELADDYSAFLKVDLAKEVKLYLLNGSHVSTLAGSSNPIRVKV